MAYSEHPGATRRRRAYALPLGDSVRAEAVMSRSLFVALLTSFFLLVGCQYPGEPISFGSTGDGGVPGSDFRT